jgi:hypothetical protein
MAPVPARASAHHPQVYGLPPRQVGMAISAMCAIFMAGLLLGLLVKPPPSMERCIGAPDAIGCLILSLD